MSTTIDPTYVNPKGAATRLGVSVSFLAKARMTHTGPAYAKFGKSVRYSVAELDRWAQAQRVQPSVTTS